MTITNRAAFVTMRNRFFSAMQQKERQGTYELRVGASTSAPQTAQSMREDYPALQEISALQQPDAAAFARATEIFRRHGFLG